MRDFQTTLTSQTVERTQAEVASRALLPEQRRQIYGNITYISERAKELQTRDMTHLKKTQEKLQKEISTLKRETVEIEIEKVEKQIKTTEDKAQREYLGSKLEKLNKTVDNIFTMAPKLLKKKTEKEQQLVAVEQQMKAIEHRYQKFHDVLDAYYKQFSFTDSELGTASYQELSLEAHRPTNSHLGNYARDIIQGAKDLLQAKRTELGDQPQFKAFEEAIKAQETLVKTDPRLENGNPNVKLDLEKSKWKKQLKDAGQATSEIFSNLKAAYIAMEKASGNNAVSDKEVAKLLTNARDEVINNRMGLSAPIDRTISVPTGDLPSQKEEDTIPLKHTMTCQNQGYSCSAFRGRDPTGPIPQPNWWDVQIEVGGKKLAYSRSAIQNEFFAENQAKREQATKVQVLEILSQKAEKQYKKQPDQGAGVGTKEKPFVLKTTAVSLLSPDCIRGTIAANPKLSHLLKEKTGYVNDISKDEARMLQENRDAWMSFDEANAKANTWKNGDKFQYVDHDGNKREVIVHITDDKDQRKVSYEIVRTDPKTQEKSSFFVQFDIAYYNVGCDKMTKQMTEAMSTTQVTQKLTQASEKLLDKIFEKNWMKWLISLVNTAPGRWILKKCGVDLTEAMTKKFLDPNVGALERLLAIAPSILNGIIKSSIGLDLLQGQLKKDGIKLDDMDMARLATLKLPTIDATKPLSGNEAVNAGLQTLKAILTNPTTQKIFINGLREETGIEATHEDLDKVAKSLPKEVQLNEQVGVEDMAQLGFPLFKTLLENPIGKKIILYVAAEQGIPLKEEELTNLNLPESFTAIPGNLIEDSMNEKAFNTHKKRIEDKLKNTNEQKEVLHKKITAKATDPNNESAQREINDISNINSKISNLRKLREALVQKEEAYSKNKGVATKAAKDKAFSEWQKARKDIENDIDSKLKMKNEYSEEFQDYLNIIHYEENLIALRDEVSDQLRFKAYRSLEFMKQNMYSLPSTIMTLAIYLDEDPHTSCRSGKDRTTGQDVEITTKVATEAQHGTILNYREMEQNPSTLDTRQNVLLNSGQIDELAFMNTGGTGLNMAGTYGNTLCDVRTGKTWQATVEGGVAHAFSRTYK